MLKISEISSFDDFAKLKVNWNKVLEKSRDNNVFLTWEYISTAWKYFHEDGEKLRTLVIEDDKSEIIAIAPLRQSRYRFLGPIGYDVVEPLAYGIGDYTGLIIAEREIECLKIFLNYLAKLDDWDFIYLYDLPEDSTIPRIMSKGANRSSHSFHLENGVLCPYLSLPNSLDILMKGLSKNLRQNLRKYMRRLEENNRKVEIKKHDDFGSIKNAMAIFFKLHQKRWESKRMSGALATQKKRDFFIDVAEQFANKGWLALYFLTVNDEPIAAAYNFIYNQKMHYLLGGFDPAYSQFSVGHLLHQRVIEDCVLRQIKEYDFLKGSEPYKFAWTKKYRRNLGVRFVNNKSTSIICNMGIEIAKQIKIDKILRKRLAF